jgi:hypothetical protein
MMQAVRSSCPPPPACTLRAGSRTAVRSRSPSLRRIRAAASPAESGPGCPPGLSQALENLGEVVRAPHFDRTLAQSLTDVVAAEAALAVTRYEAVKTVARKDVEVACKELEVARKDLEVAEARAAAAGAERLLQARAGCRGAAWWLKVEECQWVGWLSNLWLPQPTTSAALSTAQYCPGA